VGTCPCSLPTPIVVDASWRLFLDADKGRKPQEIAMRTGEYQGRTAARNLRSDSRRNPGIIAARRARPNPRSGARGQRRQAGVTVARRRQDHHRHPRQGPRLSGPSIAPRLPLTRNKPAAAAEAGQTARLPSPMSFPPASAFSTTGRNIFCSSRPAARSPKSRTGFLSNSAICSRRHRRFGSSTQGSATAPYCRA